MKHQISIIIAFFLSISVYAQDFDWCIEPSGELDICIDIPTDYSITDIQSIFPCQIEILNDSCFNVAILPGYQGILDEIVLSCDSLNNCQTDTINFYVSEECGDSCNDIPYADCVWPGDTNNDSIANAEDLLNLGLINGTEGLPRDTVTIDWVGHAAFDWEDELFNSLNAKYVDCDGNGIIEIETDMDAIIQNYGLTHAKTNEVQEDATLLFVDFTEEVIEAGAASEANILLGTIEQMPENSHGIAFSLFYDTNLIKDISIDWSNSWLGNIVGMTKHFPEHGRIDIALTRTDGIGVSDHGAIAQITFTTKEVVIGTPSMAMGIAPLAYVNELGESLALGAQSDEMSITGTPTHLIEKKYNLNVYPNPTNDQVYIETDVPEEDLLLNIYDHNGHLIQQIALHHKGNHILDTSEWSTGLYYYQVYNESKLIRKDKLIILK